MKKSRQAKYFNKIKTEAKPYLDALVLEEEHGPQHLEVLFALTNIDANTGEMMEMCLKTGHLLKLGSPPSEDMKFPASALRHKKPVPAHLRPKERREQAVTRR